jgi:ATP-dependent Lhr-like helicase
MFGTRWRWNLSRSLLISRTQGGGKRVPTPLLRMRAEDELVRAFPQALACPETLPPGDQPVPWEHPMVRQTIEDCLHEAMDVDGFLEVLRGLRDGTIRKIAVDTREPSAFARGILNVMPYGFLDDAPLEERRTQAVQARHRLDTRTADTLGALDENAVARVREQAPARERRGSSRGAPLDGVRHPGGGRPVGLDVLARGPPRGAAGRDDRGRRGHTLARGRGSE